MVMYSIESAWFWVYQPSSLRHSRPGAYRPSRPPVSKLVLSHLILSFLWMLSPLLPGPPVSLIFYSFLECPFQNSYLKEFSLFIKIQFKPLKPLFSIQLKGFPLLMELLSHLVSLPPDWAPYAITSNIKQYIMCLPYLPSNSPNYPVGFLTSKLYLVG